MFGRIFLQTLSPFAVVLPLLGSPSAAATRPDWIRAEADGVAVFSNAGPKEATEVVVSYLAYRDALHRLLSPVDRNLDPTAVMLFKTRTELAEIRSDSPQYSRDVALTTQVDGESVVAVAFEGNRQEALETVFEFDTVRRLPAMGYDLPLWMQRGIASTISSLQTGETSYKLGLRLNQLVPILKRKTWLPWREVSEMRSTSVAYHSPESFDIFAAQSWALVRMVMFTDPAKARERFSALQFQFRETRQADVAAAKVLGLQPTTLAAELKRHAQAKASLVVPFDMAAARRSVRISPAPAWEIALFKARLMQGFLRHDAAEAELAKAMADAPKHPAVLGAMGRQRLARIDTRAGVDYYRAAIAAGASNPKYLLISARARLDDVAGPKGDLPGQGGNWALEAIKEIRQALALAPGDGEAYGLLGRAFFVCEKVDEAEINELSPGLASDQHGGSVRYYRALLEQRLGRHAASVEDLKLVLRDTSLPAKQRHAMLQSFAGLRAAAVTRQAEQLVKAGDYQAALTLVDEMLDPAVWNILATQRQNLREWIEASARAERP